MRGSRHKSESHADPLQYGSHAEVAKVGKKHVLERAAKKSVQEEFAYPDAQHAHPDCKRIEDGIDKGRHDEHGLGTMSLHQL